MRQDGLRNSSRKRLYGLSLMALSGIYLVMSNTLMQLLTAMNTEHIDSYGIVFIRGLLTFLISAIFLLLARINPIPNWKVVVTQIFLGINVILGIIFMYLSLELIPLGDATAIQASAPIFTTFLSITFLKQKASIMDFICCAAGVLGLVIITRPTAIFGVEDNESREICAKITGKKTDLAFASNGTDYVIGVVYSILTALMLAVFFVLTKYVGKQTDFMVGMLYIGLTGIVIPLLKDAINFTLPKIGITIKEWAVAVLISLLAYISIMMVSASLQLEDAGPASIVRYADFVYAFVIQYLLFKIAPSLLSITGALIIVASTLSLTIYRHVTSNRHGND